MLHLTGARATCATVGVMLALLSAPVPAQEHYPSKPIRFVNPFPPGGPSDILARSLAESLQGSLKQPVIVENKPGVNGSLGAGVVAKSPPDGYTVLIGIDTTFTINPHIYKNITFKTSDLKPILVLASSGLLVGVNAGTGIRTMADLVARGKSKGVTFGSGSSGSPGHLAAELFSETTHAKVSHVPYKGNTAAVVAVIASEVDGGILATPGMLPHVQSGKIIPLAVTSAQRSKMLPNVPTVAEAGYPGLQQEALYIAMVPATTPEPIVTILQKAMIDGLARVDTQARLASLDLRPEGQTGATAARMLQTASERYAKLIQATGMQVD